MRQKAGDCGLQDIIATEVKRFGPAPNWGTLHPRLSAGPDPKEVLQPVKEVQSTSEEEDEDVGC